MIFGEAPGPNGADKSGIPFFGDKAGLPVYEALMNEERCRMSKPIEGIRWDGAALRGANARTQSAKRQIDCTANTRIARASGRRRPARA